MSGNNIIFLIVAATKKYQFKPVPKTNQKSDSKPPDTGISRESKSKKEKMTNMRSQDINVCLFFLQHNLNINKVLIQYINYNLTYI